jgi:aryl-alcohol dehydrogenase-like predicted oxidoreductase
MDALVREGKIRWFGISNYASWQILEMIHHQTARGATQPVVAQQIYNLLIRQLDVEYAAFARKYRLHTTVYNPLAGGLLTGKHAPGDAVPKGSRFDGNKLYLGRYWSSGMLELAATYASVAKRAGTSLVELSYAWLAARPFVDSILVGPGTVAHLEDAVRAIEQPVSPEVLAEIDAVNRAFLGTETTYAR